MLWLGGVWFCTFPSCGMLSKSLPFSNECTIREVTSSQVIPQYIKCKIQDSSLLQTPTSITSITRGNGIMGIKETLKLKEIKLA